MSKNRPKPTLYVIDYFETSGILKEFYSHKAAITWANKYELSTGNRVKVKNHKTGQVYPHKDVKPVSKPLLSARARDLLEEKKALKNRKRLAKSHERIDQQIKQGTYKPKGRPVNVRLERMVTVSNISVTAMQGRKGKTKVFEHKQVEGFAKASRYYLDVQEYLKKKELAK